MNIEVILQNFNIPNEIRYEIIEYNRPTKISKYLQEELVEKTWHPSRFQEWCLNEDEKKRFLRNIFE